MAMAMMTMASTATAASRLHTSATVCPRSRLLAPRILCPLEQSRRSAKCGIRAIAAPSAPAMLPDASRAVLQILGKTLAATAIVGEAIKNRLFQINAERMKMGLIQGTAPLFFAAMSQGGVVTTPLTVIAGGMSKWLELYSAVMLIRVLLSWFPNIPWDRQPCMAIRDMCDPYLNLFRNIIPPVFNALDLSPMLAFMVLGTLSTILNSASQGPV